MNDYSAWLKASDAAKAEGVGAYFAWYLDNPSPIVARSTTEVKTAACLNAAHSFKGSEVEVSFKTNNSNVYSVIGSLLDTGYINEGGVAYQAIFVQCAGGISAIRTSHVQFIEGR